MQRLVSSTSQNPQWRRPGSIDYLRDIVESRVYGLAKQTPLQYAPSLSAALPTGNTILLKREDLQESFSFNIRGAYNKISNLSPTQCKNGIIACSAGNHAQGVALSGFKLGIDTMVVLPLGTPASKIDTVEKYGAQVVLYGEDFEGAQDEALRLARRDGRTLIHPFDDPLVIAGQGTVAMEIIKQTSGKSVDAIFVPVGGGGLVSGIAAYIKEISPKTKVFGVEAENANPLELSLKQGKRITLSHVNRFTDEAAVSTDDICAAIKDGFGDTRSLMEPLGALGIAGVKKYCRTGNVQGQNLIVVTAAANMDFNRLRFVAERSDDRERFVSVSIPENSQCFQKLYEHIYPRNVTELSYRKTSEEHQIAHLCLSFHTSTPEDFEQVLQKINETEGMSIEDLSENEMAKSHLRHLVGGRVENVSNERVYRMEFPERPGALKEFLHSLVEPINTNTQMIKPWNLSLFHYRNHGADVGRVLVGFQVHPEEESNFVHYLNKLGFSYVEETHNPAYTHFLK